MKGVTFTPKRVLTAVEIAENGIVNISQSFLRVLGGVEFDEKLPARTMSAANGYTAAQVWREFLARAIGEDAVRTPYDGNDMVIIASQFATPPSWEVSKMRIELEDDERDVLALRFADEKLDGAVQIPMTVQNPADPFVEIASRIRGADRNQAFRNEAHFVDDITSALAQFLCVGFPAKELELCLMAAELPDLLREEQQAGRLPRLSWRT